MELTLQLFAQNNRKLGYKQDAIAQKYIQVHPIGGAMDLVVTSTEIQYLLLIT